MEKNWKVLQVGMGDFGSTWLERVLLAHPKIGKLAVVDRNAEKLDRAVALAGERELAVYLDVEEAIAAVRPDLIINVTQPHLHEEVNFAAFAHGIPVLCEKPLAEKLEEALRARDRSRESGIPLMVSENYRYFAIAREVRRLLAEEAIGKLHAVQADFRRCHRMENYHGEMEHPLLLDVTVHHMDMLRYFTGENAGSLYARGWNPGWSWYEGITNANLLLAMKSGVEVSYRGSLTCGGSETDWLGHWCFEGEKGALQFMNGQVELTTGEGTRRWKVGQERDSRWAVLDECLASLAERRPGETDVEDNLHTSRIIQAAIDSIREDKRILLDGRM